MLQRREQTKATNRQMGRIWRDLQTGRRRRPARWGCILVRSQGSSTFREPQLSDYDYIRFLTKSRLAWEYLRRNRDYRRDWRICAPGRPQFIDLKDGTVMLRARRRFMRAEAWGLCMFCRPR